MTVQMARSRTSNIKGETSSRCSLAPKIVIASITEIAAATIESTRHARLGTALEEGLERTPTTEGIPFTAAGHWFRADSTRLDSCASRSRQVLLKSSVEYLMDRLLKQIYGKSACRTVLRNALKTCSNGGRVAIW